MPTLADVVALLDYSNEPRPSPQRVSLSQASRDPREEAAKVFSLFDTEGTGRIGLR